MICVRNIHPPRGGYFLHNRYLICILDHVVRHIVSATTALNDKNQEYKRTTVASAVSATEAVVAGSSVVVATAAQEQDNNPQAAAIIHK